MGKDAESAESLYKEIDDNMCVYDQVCGIICHLCFMACHLFMLKKGNWSKPGIPKIPTTIRFVTVVMRTNRIVLQLGKWTQLKKEEGSTTKSKTDTKHSARLQKIDIHCITRFGRFVFAASMSVYGAESCFTVC